MDSPSKKGHVAQNCQVYKNDPFPNPFILLQLHPTWCRIAATFSLGRSHLCPWNSLNTIPTCSKTGTSSLFKKSSKKYIYPTIPFVSWGGCLFLGRAGCSKSQINKNIQCWRVLVFRTSFAIVFWIRSRLLNSATRFFNSSASAVDILSYTNKMCNSASTTPECGNHHFSIPSMYGIFTYIYHKNQPNVGKYTIHGYYGFSNNTESPLTGTTAVTFLSIWG